MLWDYPEGLNPSQALDLMQKRLEILGSTALGQWVVDCEVMQSTSAVGELGLEIIYLDGLNILLLNVFKQLEAPPERLFN